MSFVKISRAQFETWANQQFNDTWEWTLPTHGRELVIRKQSFHNSPFELHIYTSVTEEAGETRDIGEDAIRIIVFDPKAGKAICSLKKVLRVEGKTTVFERLSDRVIESAREVELAVKHLCPKCSAHMVERTNRRTGEQFWGCGAFPNCGNTLALQQRYPLRELGSTSHQDVTFPPSVYVTQESKAAPVSGIELEEAVVPTSSYPHLTYKFPTFNRVQSTIIKHELWEKDCNLILGTTTSSGKTIAAELFIGHTLAQGKKVVYSAPLRSLSREKFEDWKVRFAPHTICILTGDFILSSAKADELQASDIICVTSEMLDSRTRNYKSEKSNWLFDVGLIILDETHIIGMPERGHAVEAGLTRFSKLVPDARVLCLSATLPNVEHFSEWLKKVNGKDTYTLNSTWRPTKLTWTYLQHEVGTRYHQMQESKREMALNIVTAKPDQKFLVFVHDKNTGRQLEWEFKNAGIATKFHNADLELEDRIGIESDFENRENGLRVLISSSTLAWGRNTPARNVVITGVHRGINDVDPMDIIQMGGRAGRYGIDDEGDVYLICDNPHKWEYLVNNPSPVMSTLLNVDVLGFHVLAEIKNGEVWNKDTLKNWFLRTLASVQSGELADTLIEEVFSKLVNWGMAIIEENGVYKITRLGRVSATLYYMPSDVRHWASGFEVFNRNPELWKSDVALAYVLGTTPSVSLGYVPANERDVVQDYTIAVRNVWPDRSFPPVASVIAQKLYDWFTRQESSHYIKAIQYDTERLVQALTWIDGIKQWHQEPFWKALPIRMKYGVGPELVELCQLPGIGAVRAKRLHQEGITGTESFIRNPKTVELLLGKAVAAKALQAAKFQLRQKAEE